MTSVDNMFSLDKDLAESGHAEVATAFAKLTATPEWLLLKGLVEHIAQAKALTLATGPLPNTVDMIAVNQAEARGFIRGMREVVDSVERTINVHRAKTAEDADRDRERADPRRYYPIPLSGRGAV